MEKIETPTPEQIKEYEEKMLAHYTAVLPFLRVKAEHDTLQTEIAESRIRTIQAEHAFRKYMLNQEESEKGKKVEAENTKD